MKKIPTLHPAIPSLTAHQKNSLFKWEKLYRLSKDNAETVSPDSFSDPFDPLDNRPDEPFDPSLTNNELDRLVALYDTEIHRKEIRILSSTLTPASDHPVYVAVLSDWNHEDFDGFLIAPFSPFTEPATATELAFPDRPPSLRVLELWNTHSVQSALLEKSWLIDKLSDPELEDALSIFRHAILGTPVPDSLQTRVGSPIFSPSDLRRLYQSEEIHRMEHLANEVAAIASSPNNIIPFPNIFENAPADKFFGNCIYGITAAAADDILPKQDKFTSLSVLVNKKIYRILFFPEKKSAHLSFVDANDAPTHDFDGCTLSDASTGEHLATIEKSQAFLRHASDISNHDIAFHDPSGAPIPISLAPET